MCVQQLLSAIKTHEGNPGEWSLKLAYLEIYNETITDLLTGQSGLNLYERREGGVSVDGIREVSAVKWADAMDVLAEGDERRHISATVHNDRSSRAHTVFRVRLILLALRVGIQPATTRSMHQQHVRPRRPLETPHCI
eukprot:596072-Pleurochrysis_carterae.AAC.1